MECWGLVGCRWGMGTSFEWEVMSSWESGVGLKRSLKYGRKDGYLL